jgi:beta-lactam-binding protein with PASTA domain
MARSASAFVVAAVMIASGCMGSSSSSPSPSTSAANPKESPSQMVRIPKAGGVGIGEVIPRLHRAGLQIAIPKAWALNSFQGPTASVLAPHRGTSVPIGSVVSLGISGVVGSPWEKLGPHIVPKVLGQNLGQATKQIRAAGLPWDVHATALPPTSTANLYSAYCVTSQTPSSGTAIAIRRGSHHTRMVELQAKAC